MYEFPFELDDFQKDACRCITDGKSVVVCAPTGAGKTVIAQHAIHCAFFCTFYSPLFNVC